MSRCNKRSNLALSRGTVVRPGEMPVEVCLSSKRTKFMPSSAVVLLPDEIMTEVFLRLPIKSILRFRAVCRSWAALLSSEEFCSLHMAATEVAPTPRKLLFVSPTANFDSTAIYSCSLSARGDDLLFTLDDARGNFVDVTPAPCRGLTLLYDAVVPAYYVCNAATRAITRLPPCYDVPNATAGLGFDAQTKKYKVVRFFQGRGHEKQAFNCEVYTLGGEEGDHWRPVSGGVPFRFCNFARSAIWYAVFRKMQPVFADGFLHWLIEPAFFAKMPRAAIISFSLTNETFSWVRSPPFVVSGAHLVELDGHLCMVRDLRKDLPAGSMLEIWKLKDCTSGDWSLNHQIDLLGHLPREFLEPQVVKVIGSFGSSKSSKRIIIATSKHKVFAYDPLSGTLETIHSAMEIHASHQIEPSDTRFSLFRESLAPVHKTKEEIALSSPLAKVTKEILLRIPARSALNLKLVCKQWLRLIKSESFAHPFFLRKNMDKRPKIMLVGKGTGQPGFSFIPLNKWLQEPSNKRALLDTKVVCSKPCHGLNLVSIEKKDYLYNPCTGFHRINFNRRSHMHQLWKLHIDCIQPEDHPFSVGNKNVGLGFDPLIQEHIIVEFFYPLKDYESRQYYLTCSLWSCNSQHVQQLAPPPLPVNDMPPAYLEGVLYWMSEPRLGQSHKRAIISFNNATKIFDIIPCPSCIAIWSSCSPSHAYVVELDGVLCAVLANPAVHELDIWKWEFGQWDRAYTIYLNRGIGSGKGKTAGRGHKGQKARGKAMFGFEGGQTPLRRRLPRRGFKNRFSLTFQPCGLGKIAKLINAGKIDSSELITMKTLKDTGAIGKQIKDGIRLMGRGAEEIKWPIHLEVSRATARAKAAVEAAGGTVRLVYYNKLGFRALLKPEWFEKKGRLLPKAARPPPKQRDKVDSIGRLPAPTKPLPFTQEELEFAAKRDAARVIA